MMTIDDDDEERLFAFEIDYYELHLSQLPITPDLTNFGLLSNGGLSILTLFRNGIRTEERKMKLNFEILDAIIESFYPSPYTSARDIDSLMEDIDIFLAPEDSIPLGIENDDYDSEGDVLSLKELLNNDYISLSEYESFHVDFYSVPSFPRPPRTPPNDDDYFDIEPDTGFLTTKVVDNISDNRHIAANFMFIVPRMFLPTLTHLYPVFATLFRFIENEDSKKYDQIPPEEKSMVVLLVEERILKAMQTLEEKPESMQELLLQFSKDLQTLDENSNQLKQEEQAAKVSSQYWNPPIFYDDDDDDDEESYIPLR
ncbi:hypothetical protein Tco_0399654 [Tanacetum coccineum]